MGNITDETRTQNGLTVQEYYDQAQRRARRERYLSQIKEIQDMPDSSPLEQCAKLRKYYSIVFRYNKNLLDLLYEWDPTLLDDFMRIKVLKPYKDTVWLDKDKLAEFEEFITEA